MKADAWAGAADEELVLAALLGHLAAFDELVRRFRPAVRLTVRSFAGDAEEVEDLCQETFLRAFQALPRLEQPDRFAAWLQVIARNLARRAWRNRRRDRARIPALDEPVLEETASPEPGPAEAFEHQEARRLIRAAVEALPRPYREVVELHYWERMPLTRVAAYLGVPLSTAKWRLRYARSRLQRELIGINEPEEGEER